MVQHSLETRPSVLIIGAAGRTGVEVINQLSQHPSSPYIHAFCHHASKLREEQWDRCTSVLEGDARHAVDIEEALKLTNANWIVLCAGTGDSVARSNIRTYAAENTVRVLERPGFQHVKVLVISMVGTKYSRQAVGRLNSFRLRHVIADHRGQEAAFRKIKNRTIIVRSTVFKEDFGHHLEFAYFKHQRSPSISSESSSTSDHSASISTVESSIISVHSNSLSRSFGQNTTKIIQFGEHDRIPSKKTIRYDLASWITKAICDNHDMSAHSSDFDLVFREPSLQVVNVTSILA